MPRCLEFVISYVAILKAGGAYLPVEVAYPELMLVKVFREVKPKVVLSLPAQLAALKPSQDGGFAQTVLTMGVGTGWEQLIQLSEDAAAALPPITTHLDSLAYAVYSSGTTGEPKGITCPHRGSVLSYTYRQWSCPYSTKQVEREACSVFFVWEMLRPLLGGATLVVVPDTVVVDPPTLCNFLSEQKVTRRTFPPHCHVSRPQCALSTD